MPELTSSTIIYKNSYKKKMEMEMLLTACEHLKKQANKKNLMRRCLFSKKKKKQ